MRHRMMMMVGRKEDKGRYGCGAAAPPDLELIQPPGHLHGLRKLLLVETLSVNRVAVAVEGDGH